MTVAAEPFLNGSSGSYVEAMYESWQKDRNSVHKVRLCWQTLILCKFIANGNEILNYVDLHKFY